jgi:hypothetical protein
MFGKEGNSKGFAKSELMALIGSNRELVGVSHPTPMLAAEEGLKNEASGPGLKINLESSLAGLIKDMSVNVKRSSQL